MHKCARKIILCAQKSVHANIKFVEPCFSNCVFKVAPRFEKTEVFRKGWNFANWSYFLLWTKETVFFPYFYTMELFSTVLSYLTAQSTLYFSWISLYLNINTNQTSKEQYLNQEAATYFGISCTKRFWK